MRTSGTAVHKIFAGSACLLGLGGLFLWSPAIADIYPVTGVWITLNHDFSIGPEEACFTLRLSGVKALARNSIAELLIFNENKRYHVKRNVQQVSTLYSQKPTPEGYWLTEFSDVRRRFWFRQKITYLLTIVDQRTIEIRKNSRRATFVKCGPKGKLPI